MKKLFAIILCFIYITASSGVVLNVHYCMGKLSSVRLDNFQSSFCKCGMKAGKNGCCHSEVKVVKLNNAHKQAIITVNIESPVAVLSNNVSLIDLSKTYLSAIQETIANGPPIDVSNIYLRNCVFRI